MGFQIIGVQTGEPRLPRLSRFKGENSLFSSQCDGLWGLHSNKGVTGGWKLIDLLFIFFSNSSSGLGGENTEIKDDA